MHPSAKRHSALRRLLLFTLFSAVLLIALSALFFLHFFGPVKGTQRITLPDFCGHTIDALPAYDAEHVETVTVERFSDAPVGTVLAQSPSAGASRKAIDGKRITVTLTVSKGTERAVLPDVTGLSLSRGEARLISEGFSVRVIYRTDSAPYGEILAQAPRQGSTQDVRSTVTLTVSKGFAVRRVRVPDVTSLTERQARSLIEASGLSVGEIRLTPSSLPEGRVLNQMPLAPTLLPEGSGVQLTLSSPPDSTEESDRPEAPPEEHPTEPETEQKPGTESKPNTESTQEPSPEDLIDRILHSLFPESPAH